jgi:hypothetical protein
MIIWQPGANTVARPGSLGIHVGCLAIAIAIAIVGQLYVAMLIGLILGRFNQTMRR